MPSLFFEGTCTGPAPLNLEHQEHQAILGFLDHFPRIGAPARRLSISNGNEDMAMSQHIRTDLLAGIAAQLSLLPWVVAVIADEPRE